MSVHAATALAFGSKVETARSNALWPSRRRGEAHRAREDRTVCQAAESLCLATTTDTGIGLRQRIFIELTRPTGRPVGLSIGSCLSINNNTRVT